MKKLIAFKNLFIMAGLVFLQFQAAFTQQNYLAYSAVDKSPSFSDGFDNNTNQWITDNLWISGKISDGFYNIICKNYQQSTGLSYKLITVSPNQNYEIEAAFKVIRGTGALVFGMTDRFDHYRVELTDNNTLEVIKDTPSKKKKIEKLFSGTGNFHISKDINKLTVRYMQGIYYIFANELIVGQFSNIKPEGSQIGFNVGTDSEISVDFLKVFNLKSPASTNIAQRDASVPEKSVTGITNQNADGSPVIKWVSPSGQNTTLDYFNAKVRASIRSVTGLKSVLLYLNGVSKGETEILPAPGEPGVFTVEKSINFSPGENNIYLVATNNEGATKSELRYFTNPSAVAPVVAWSSPETVNTLVNTESFTIGACIKSPTELKSVKLLVNGSIQTEDNVFQTSNLGDCNYNWKSSIVLKEGDNNIYVIATNVAGSTTSEKRLIRLQPALAERRLALIFGNSVYKNNSTLKNPVNDANLMEGTLKELGFEVIKRLNSGKTEMEAAIREFTERLPNYNVALFYYAGHGVQVDGKNYLIPTDALLEKPTDCKFDAVAVNFVVDEFERYPDNTNIVILDACRNNPYATWARGGDAGFKAMNFTSGTIISFATSEGATAADGKGANGLFTEELVKQMVIPQSVYSVFMKTRVEVKKLSNNQQIPTEWNKLNGDFFFRK
jgi:hypothetical protein